jgi:hypothetical protein
MKDWIKMIVPLINSKGQFCFLDTQEINYIQTNGAGDINIHSFDKKYRAISMVRNWSLLLQNSDFMQMDRGTIVILGTLFPMTLF